MSQRKQGSRRVLVLGVAAALVVLALVAGAAVWASEGGRSVVIEANDQAAPATPAELTAAGQSRVFLGHQSVGGNLIAGLPRVYAAAGLAEPRVVESRSPLGGTDQGHLQHALIGINTDPIGKIADFERIIDDGVGAGTDVALMKLCYVDFNADTDVQAVFEAYVATMDRLEKQHPNVVFLYTTAPLTSEPAILDRIKATIKAWLGRKPASTPENLVRERYNELVRGRYAASGRLLDIAALESRLTSGGEGAKNVNGEPYRVMNPEFTSDGGHLNEMASERIAGYLMKLVARNTPQA